MRSETRLIGGVEFWLVGTLEIQRTSNGVLAEYTHELADGVQPNLYARGPFCRFGLSAAPHAEGVYAVIIGGTVQYIGECADLVKRFGSSGYGFISRRNCHHDGQSTNCKLNSRVLAAAKMGHPAQVWFCSSDDRKRLESELITALSPSWNGRAEEATRPRTTQQSGAKNRSVLPRIGDESTQLKGDFRVALLEILRAAESAGVESIQVSTGDLHRRVGGYPGRHHRMPSCCAIMRSAMQPGDRIVYEPPKRNGASVLVEYRLPRRSDDAFG